MRILFQPVILLLILFTTELYLLTFGNGDFTPIIQSTLYAFLILLNVGSMLYFPLKPSIVKPVCQNNNKGWFFATALLCGIVLIGTLYYLRSLYSTNSVDPAISDIIPSLETYVQRFLNGEKVYVPIEMPGWTVQPTYLPLMWLPFTLPELMNIDYRWFPLAILLLSVGYMLFDNEKRIFEYPIIGSMLIFWPMLSLFVLSMRESTLFANTVEVMIAGFYLLLLGFYRSKKSILIAIGLVLCLLSRFSLVFWLLPFGVLFYHKTSYSKLLKIALFTVAGIMIIYIIPFLWADPSVFTKGIEYYTKAAVGEWQLQDWQSAGDYPANIGSSYGFATFIYTWMEGSVLEQVSLLQKIHLIASLFSALLISIIYWIQRNLIKRTHLFLFMSLKVYLMIFYFFIQVPYLYLFVTPLFISVAILAEYVRSSQKKM